VNETSIIGLLSDAREVYSALGNARKALVLVDSALQKAPERVDALNLKAAILYDLDRDAEAMAYHQQVLAIQPSSVEALHGMAAIANDAGDYTGALAWTDKGLRSIPEDTDPEFLENEDFRQRLTAELYNERAFALWYLGRKPEAIYLLTEEGPAMCPMEVETLEDELAWLEGHPHAPDA